MRSVPPGAFVCASILATLLLILTAVPAAGQGTQDGDHLILAFYYAWFDWSTWSRELCDQPQNVYVSADAGAVERHLRQAESAGIDAFIQPWYGSVLSGNPTEPNLSMLLSEARDSDMAVAAALDMTGDHLATGTEVAEALIYLRDEHQPAPAYLNVDDRSVVFFMGQDQLSLASWEAIRNRVDPNRSMIWIAEAGDAATLDVFDGLYLYRISDTAASDVLSSFQLNRWGGEVRRSQADAGERRYWVASVFPGFDESYITEEDDEDLITVFERDGGSTYRDRWSDAIGSTPDWVAIRSFNEWPLCTHIEPSILYGNTYLDLTRDLISDYRRSLVPTATATQTSTPTATPTLTPTLTAVIEPPDATPEPSPTLTPTVTLTPSATPYRLATPTPTFGASVGRTPAATATGRPIRPLDTIAPEESGPADRDATPTMTPLPRPIVEGESSRRCMLVPLWLTVTLVVVYQRRSRAPV